MPLNQTLTITFKISKLHEKVIRNIFFFFILYWTQSCCCTECCRNTKLSSR